MSAGNSEQASHFPFSLVEPHLSFSPCHLISHPLWLGFTPFQRLYRYFSEVGEYPQTRCFFLCAWMRMNGRTGFYCVLLFVQMRGPRTKSIAVGFTVVLVHTQHDSVSQPRCQRCTQPWSCPLGAIQLWVGVGHEVSLNLHGVAVTGAQVGHMRPNGG